MTVGVHRMAFDQKRNWGSESFGRRQVIQAHDFEEYGWKYTIKHIYQFRHVLTAELGDYDADTHTAGYVSELRLAPQQSEDLEQAIQSSHQKLM